MTALERTCRELRDRGRKALVPFVTAGFPDEATSLSLLRGCAERGCPVVEVGVPFSDPVADGPVIQWASQAALDGGMTLRRALALVGELAGSGARPVVMTYLNPVLRLGFAAFATEAAKRGVAGVIVPDLSREDSSELRAALTAEGLALVDLVAPTTPPERLALIAGPAAGFLYLVAVAGVTGTRSAVAAELSDFTAGVREHTDLPLYIGFGVDGPQRARDVAACADGAIVGSALIRKLIENPDPRAGADRALALVDELQAALDDTRRRSL